jgi:hypothetical protein
MAIVEPVLARRLRWFVAIAFGVAAAIAIVAALPGERVVREPCATSIAQDAVNALARTSSAGCSDTEAVVRYPATGGSTLWIVLALVLGPGLAIARWPARGRAWLWTGWTLVVALGAAFVVLSEDLFNHIFEERTHVETLWPHDAVIWGCVGFAALFVMALPAILVGTPAPPRPPDLPDLPEARVVS